MIEEEARAALRRFVAVGDLEISVAEQSWEPTPGGWAVAGEFPELDALIDRFLG